MCGSLLSEPHYRRQTGQPLSGLEKKNGQFAENRSTESDNTPVSSKPHFDIVFSFLQQSVKIDLRFLRLYIFYNNKWENIAAVC